MIRVGMLATLCVPATLRAQTAKPFEAFSNSAQTLRDSVVQLAKAQIGTRYRRGGQSPERGFDCSGLVKYVMASLHQDVPRTARQQAAVGLAVARDTSRLLPGDVLTFGRGKRGVSHVGIYIGDGRYVHASTAAGKVVETSIDRPHSPLLKMWRGARRVVTDGDTVVAAVDASKSG